MGHLAGAVAAMTLLLAGCSVGEDPRAGEPSRPASPAPVSPAPSSPAPSSSAPRAPTQPMVVIVHNTRRPLDLSRARAGEIVAAEQRGPVAAIRAVVRRRDAVAAVPADAVGPQVQAVTVDGVDPITDPTRYPLRAPAQRPAGPVLRMSVVGDIMLGRGVADAARSSGDPSLALRPMQRRLASADITVGNLENTLSRAGTPTQGNDSFAADPRVVDGLRDAGFDAISLANNHAGDFGDRSLVQTVRRLRLGGLGTFGAGATVGQARRPLVVERDGVRFGFVGFNAIGETAEVGAGQPGAVSVSMPPRTGPLDRAELTRFLGSVRRLAGSVDVVVVLPHWGTQYTNVPEPIQRRVAQRLVGSGADVVVGGHPHWVQGSSIVDDRLVVHSLGNFVFDMDFSQETQKGLLLELTFWGSDLKAADFVPYAMDQNFAPRVQPWSAGLDTLRLMWETSGPAFRRESSAFSR